jgi:glycine hydroxymethyltransferase
MDKKIRNLLGHSAYPRDLDYKRFREIADSVGAYLMSDIAHISGLIAAEEHANPFLHSHIVTSTTHKSLRGPRSGLIFYTKDPASLSQIKSKAQESLEESINASIFPRLQGGPHNHQIAGVCTQLKEVNSLEFKEYIKQVKKNAITLAEGIMDKGGKLLTNGTENHLILWDLKPQALTGKQ